MISESDSFIFLQDDFLGLIRGNTVKINMIDLIKWFAGGANGRVPIDRTDTIKCELRTKSIFPMPDFDLNFDKDLPTIFEDTARDIINENKPIDIFWSGGVDSTAIVVAFLKVCKDLNQINIMFEPRSIDEYPLFFDRYVKNMNYTILDTYISRSLRLDDHIVITGEGGGMLFGQAWGLKSMLVRCGLDGDEAFCAPWRDVINPQVGFFLNKNCDDFFADCISEQLKYAPFKIETIGDLRWWVVMSMKWEPEWFLRLKWQTSITQEKLNNFRPFFMTDDFQKWGASNFYRNVRHKFPLFKHDYKKFIYDFTKDEEYFANKGKVNSGAVRNTKDKNIGRYYIDAIDNNYNIHTTANFSNRDLTSFRQYKQKLIEQYGNPESEYKKWIKN